MGSGAVVLWPSSRGLTHLRVESLRAAFPHTTPTRLCNFLIASPASPRSVPDCRTSLHRHGDSRRTKHLWLVQLQCLASLAVDTTLPVGPLLQCARFKRCSIISCCLGLELPALAAREFCVILSFDTYHSPHWRHEYGLRLCLFERTTVQLSARVGRRWFAWSCKKIAPASNPNGKVKS